MAEIIKSEENSSFDVQIEAQTLGEALKLASELSDDPKTKGYKFFRLDQCIVCETEWNASWF